MKRDQYKVGIVFQYDNRRHTIEEIINKHDMRVKVISKNGEVSIETLTYPHPDDIYIRGPIKNYPKELLK